MSNEYRNSKTEIALGTVGAFLGAAIPIYLGWEIGEYVQRSLELGQTVGTIAKFGSAGFSFYLLEAITLPKSVELGCAAGSALRKLKNSLEAKIKINQE